MRIFVKQSHLPYSFFIVSVSVICVIAAIGVPLRDRDVWACSCRILAILLLTIIFVRYVKTFGIYIDGEKFLYKSFFQKHVDIQTIVAIRVARAVWLHKYGKEDQMIGQDGAPLYTMLFMKDYSAEMHRDLHDMAFRNWFKKQIICFSTYNQSVIDYLLTLNPNIIVF